MKKVVVSRFVKSISASGDYLVVELVSGVMTIEKPKYIGLHLQSDVLDSRDVTSLVGALFFLLVLGVFLDYFNQLPLSIWYMITILLIGLVLISLLAIPRKSVLVIETSNKVYYFTRSREIDERSIKEIVAKMYSVNKATPTTSDNTEFIATLR